MDSPDGSSGLLGGVGGGVTGISAPTEDRTDRIKSVISSISAHPDGLSSVFRMPMRVCGSPDQFRMWVSGCYGGKRTDYILFLAIFRRNDEAENQAKVYFVRLEVCQCSKI